MGRGRIIGILGIALTAMAPSAAHAATLAPAAVSFGSHAVGSASGPKAFTVTAEPADVALPLTIAVTGDYRQANDCPATIGFLTTMSCTVSVTFHPTATGNRSGILSTTTLLLGGPTATLIGEGTRAANKGAKKCKRKAKKKTKKTKRKCKRKKKKKKKKK
jgi:hypothetical protein